MKPTTITFMASAACVITLGLALRVLTSTDSAYADPQPTEQSHDELISFPIFLAEAGDETERPLWDQPPASRPREESDFRKDRDRKPGERFPGHFGKRGMGSRGKEGPMGRGPGHGRERDHGGFRDFMTSTEVDKLMDFLKQQIPDLYEQLRLARETDPRSFWRMLRRIGEPIYHIYRIYQRDPELAKVMIAEHKVQMEIFALQRDYREAISDSERESIKAELRGQLQKRFEYRQQRLKLEIENLRKRLDEEAKRLAESEKNKQKLIEEELDQILHRLKGRKF